MKKKTIKDVRNLFRLKKENKVIKDRILRDIRNLFKHREEKKYYKPVRVGNGLSNDYIEYKNNSDKNKILFAEEYLNKIRPYIKDNTNDLKKSDTWKIQFTIKIDFISSNDDNGEERVIH